jgi:hypothetical protein
VTENTLDTIAVSAITALSVGFVWLCLNGFTAALWILAAVFVLLALVFVYAVAEDAYKEWRNRWH